MSNRPAIYVATYFGDPGAALPALARTPVEAIGVDLVAGADTSVAGVPELAGKTLVAGVVDGRNVWRTDLEAALGTLATLLGSAATVAVSTSCSTLHVPYSLEPETDLDDALRSWLAFGAEKVREVVVLARALRDGHDAVADEIASSRAAIASRKRDPRLHNGQIRARIEAIVASEPTAAMPPSAAPAKTRDCTCRRCRPRRSAPTRRPRRSALRVRRCGPVRSTRPSTCAGCGKRSPR